MSPPLRLTSRLTVEGAWPSSRAIDRIDRAAAIPREISSRSPSVNASRERRRRAGRSARIDRQARVLVIRDNRQQLLDPLPPLWRYHTELSHVGAQGIDQLRALAHQKIAGPMLHQLRLLLGRLHPHKAHGRPTYCLADRFGISRVILVALEIGLHVSRRHQSHFMTELRKFARPVMCSGTGL